jgi:hypothetical protein
VITYPKFRSEKLERQIFSPSSAVAKGVLLICKHLRMKSGDFLHYILHPY